ncbi:MAG TPA: sensor domain-containing diguanylate cyclase [Oligoflexia bacterium]|nr:sensor domain-containing diguanylate cyclase [Oligoflexia bacterium]HMR24981.1 sensor domain-containing diguanylate cyclase [Oligoflexia bacterium]
MAEQGLENLIKMAVDACNARSGSFFVYQNFEDCFAFSCGYSPSLVLDERLQKNKGIFKLAQRIDSPTCITQTRVLYDSRLYKQPLPLGCVWLVPIIKEGLFLGVMLLDFSEKKDIHEKVESFLKFLALQIVYEFDHLKEKQKFKNFQRELAHYVEAGNRLNRCFRLEEVYASAVSSIENMSQCDEVYIVRYDEQGDQCSLAMSLQQTVKGQSFTLDFRQNLVSWVIENQKSLYYADYKLRSGRSLLFPQDIDYPNEYESVYIVPLQVQKQKMGAIVIMHKINNALSFEQRHMLEVFSQHTAVAIKNAKMVDRLETLATTDGLTGVLNHRSFQDILDAELLRCQRHPGDISVVLVDIDHFKQFNDQYGHPVGDEVLKKVAQKLKDSVRKVDYVFRYGGEEFALILVNTAAKEAHILAQRIVKDIAKSQFNLKGYKLKITVSMGLASFPETAQKKEELVARADQALYQSKLNGRNQVTLYNHDIAVEKNTKEEQRSVDLFSQSI